MKKEILRINHLFKQNCSSHLLYDITLNLYEGELLCLTGARKSGKSLLVRILNGEERMDSGSYLISENPVNIKKLSLGQLEDIRIIRPQSALIPELSVAENLMLFRTSSSGRPVFLSQRRLAQKASTFLSSIGNFVNLDPCQPVSELSPCQKICLEILRHVLNHASIIILDNCCPLFTKREHETLYHFVNMLCKKKFSFIYVCSQPDALLEYSDRIFILRKGRNAGIIYREEYDREKFMRIFTGHNLIRTDTQRLCENHCEKKGLLLEASLIDTPGIQIQIYQGQSVGFLTFDNTLAQELGQVFYRSNYASPDSDFKIRNKKHVWKIKKRNARNIFILPQEADENMLCKDLTVLDNLLLFINRPFRRKQIHSCKQLNQLGKELDYLMERQEGWSQQTSACTLDKITQKTFLILRCLFFPVDILLFLYPGQELKPRYINLLRSRGTATAVITDSIPELLSTCDYIYIISRGKISEKICCKDISEEELLKMWISLQP